MPGWITEISYTKEKGRYIPSYNPSLNTQYIIKVVHEPFKLDGSLFSFPWKDVKKEINKDDVSIVWELIADEIDPDANIVGAQWYPDPIPDREFENDKPKINDLIFMQTVIDALSTIKSLQDKDGIKWLKNLFKSSPHDFKNFEMNSLIAVGVIADIIIDPREGEE